MTDLYLREGGESFVGPLDDVVGDALAASGAVTAIRVGGREWEVGPSTKVGVVTIGDVTVWIRPKVHISRVMFLLGYAKSPGWRADQVALAEVDDLVPVLAQAFADQADRAIETGLLQGYTDVDDSLTVLRGRLREQDQLRQRFGIALPLLVRYDDHTVDIPENQLLRGAAELLLRVPGVHAMVRSRLRRLRGVLAEVSAPVQGGSLPVWRPNRLNERYHVALWLAEVLLRRNAVDQVPGAVRVGGFLVDMAKVYENFLTAALTESLKQHGGWTRAQDRHHLDVDEAIAMRPDLVWYRDAAPAAVIDAKYKVEKPAGFPDADLYQMLAYCTALQLDDGHLVYAKGNADEVAHTVRHADIKIHAHTLDLGCDPTALLAQVAALANRIATSPQVALCS